MQEVGKLLVLLAISVCGLVFYVVLLENVKIGDCGYLGWPFCKGIFMVLLKCGIFF